MGDKLSVLRAGYDALRRHGALAGYTIHVAPGLRSDEAKRAAKCGPSEVNADAPYDELLQAAGFRLVLSENVTPEFETTCRAILGARRELESELRRADGDSAFEEEQEKKGRLLRGISEGLLMRSLHVAVKI